ncbi:MAG: ribose 5-phosphate isomerase B [Ferruginibacter sp.]
MSYKKILLNEIREKGFEITDLGTSDENSADDYPDHAADVANAILAKMADRGIIICGSGVGVSVAANKFKGIRAGVCHDTYSAHQCVEHDDANVLCLGERIIGTELASEIVFAFLNATFSHEERHQRRLDKIIAIETKNMK